MANCPLRNEERNEGGSSGSQSSSRRRHLWPFLGHFGPIVIVFRAFPTFTVNHLFREDPYVIQFSDGSSRNPGMEFLLLQ